LGNPVSNFIDGRSIDAAPGKVIPYGVYDITANAGCVSLGIDNDTAQFSVNSIRR
jgi:Rhodopirellula transposase DDE domain